MIAYYLVTPFLITLIAGAICYLCKLSKEFSLLATIVIGILVFLFAGPDVLQEVLSLGDMAKRISDLILNLIWIVGTVSGVVAYGWCLQKLPHRY